MATLTGTNQADTLTGGAEPDTITGGAGGDSITSGAGFDLIFIGQSDSIAANALSGGVEVLDTISDWKSTDRLMFAGGSAVAFGNFRVGAADTYADAYDVALGLYSGFSAEYIAVQVLGDTYVFVPRTGQAVRLIGVERDQVQPFNFVTGVLSGDPSGLIESGSNQADVRVFVGTGADSYNADAGDDSVGGGAGTDTLLGGAGFDQLYGGADNDSIDGADGGSYLRGDEGGDTIQGGAGFDDINGNMGNDVVFGGLGTDWVVGGKDTDLLFGEQGDDIVFGNLGNDTVGGGTGNDLVRGGQDQDVVRGDDGDDIVSGDRGSDTIFGGLGADTFISFTETGQDRVEDFNAGEGDRVQLDPGTTYGLSQVDANTVIDFGGGNQMVLVNVQLSSLPSGWIFVLGG